MVVPFFGIFSWVEIIIWIKYVIEKRTPLFVQHLVTVTSSFTIVFIIREYLHVHIEYDGIKMLIYSTYASIEFD